MTTKQLNIAFVNPPHADWSLANNMTFLMCQSHYNLVGKYKDNTKCKVSFYKSKGRGDKRISITGLKKIAEAGDTIILSTRGEDWENHPWQVKIAIK